MHVCGHVLVYCRLTVLTRGESVESCVSRNGPTWVTLAVNSFRTPELSSNGIECRFNGVLTLLQNRQNRYL